MLSSVPCRRLSVILYSIPSKHRVMLQPALEPIFLQQLLLEVLYICAVDISIRMDE